MAAVAAERQSVSGRLDEFRQQNKQASAVSCQYSNRILIPLHDLIGNCPIFRYTTLWLPHAKG